MPIKVQNHLPAKAILENENIFVMDEHRAVTQDIRPLYIVILNLMPTKEETELQLLRALSNTPLQIDVTLLCVESYVSKNTPASHLNKYYKRFGEIRGRKFDGMIITGAPVEQMPFEEVDYWEELADIMEWSKSHVFSTFHICWGAQAGLYYHYGIQKVMLEKKLSGVYRHELLHRKVLLARGMDDVFYVPQSRYTGLDEEAIAAEPRLQVVASSPEAGSYMIIGDGGRRIFITGHSEYDRVTLDQEYRRDVGRNLNPNVPVNYYPDDDPARLPLLTWRANSNCVYSNWLNYYVYQTTPYDLEKLRYTLGEEGR